MENLGKVEKQFSCGKTVSVGGAAAAADLYIVTKLCPTAPDTPRLWAVEK